MKIADLHFKDEVTYSNGKTYSDIKTMLLECEDIDFTKKVKKLIRLHTDIDSFIEDFLETREFEDTSAYRAVMKAYNESAVYGYLADRFGNKLHKVTSGEGNLKIGNDSFSLYVPNGCREDVTKYAVIDNITSYCTDLMTFFTTVEGEFNIYRYESGYKVCDTLKGRYNVFYYDGIVVFYNQNY